MSEHPFQMMTPIELAHHLFIARHLQCISITVSIFSSILQICTYLQIDLDLGRVLIAPERNKYVQESDFQDRGYGLRVLTVSIIPP